MNYIKTLSVVFFLLINGLGEHGLPNFILIPIFLFQFCNEIFAHYEISWMSGLIPIAIITSLIIISFSRGYKDRYKLLVAILILCALETYMSEILQHKKLMFWFVFPSIVFTASSLILILKIFKKPKELHTTSIE
ncbi:hypothetical protein ABIB40_002232 [Pedobacter sp. UYP30]